MQKKQKKAKILFNGGKFKGQCLNFFYRFFHQALPSGSGDIIRNDFRFCPIFFVTQILFIIVFLSLYHFLLVSGDIVSNDFRFCLIFFKICDNSCVSSVSVDTGEACTTIVNDASEAYIICAMIAACWEENADFFVMGGHTSSIILHFETNLRMCNLYVYKTPCPLRIRLQCNCASSGVGAGLFPH